MRESCEDKVITTHVLCFICNHSVPRINLNLSNTFIHASATSDTKEIQKIEQIVKLHTHIVVIVSITQDKQPHESLIFAGGGELVSFFITTTVKDNDEHILPHQQSTGKIIGYFLS